MSVYVPSTAYVYTFDASTGALRAELMRVPGSSYVPASALNALPDPTRVLPALGKDTQGLVEEVLVRRGDAVFFVERKDGKASEDAKMSEAQDDSEKENAGVGEPRRSRAVRKAMRQVREVELMARKLEAEMLAMEMEMEAEDAATPESRGAAAVESDDEDESEDESEEDDDDDESEDGSLWGDSDDESVCSEEDTSVETACVEEKEKEAIEEDEEDEELADEMALRAAERFAKEDEEDWEVALFGGNEDEADHTDAEDEMQVDEGDSEAVDDETSKEPRPEDGVQKAGVEVRRVALVQEEPDVVQEEAKDDKRTTRMVEASTRIVEHRTRPADWVPPIVPLPSTEFDVFGDGAGTRTISSRTVTRTDARTRTRAEATVDRADTRIEVTVDRRADMRTSADVDRRADVRTSANVDPRADVDRRAEPRISADVDHRADRICADVNRVQFGTRPIVPMRTSRPNGAPRMATTMKEKADSAPRITSVQVRNVRAIAGDVQSVCKGTKRKADEDDEAMRAPEVVSALARTRTLAGLKFKKVKTCHSILTTTAKTTIMPSATSDAGVDSNTGEVRVRQRAILKTGPKVRWCLDGDQKLAPRKADDGLAGRKRKCDDDKEDGEISDSEDDEPLAKRQRTMQVSRTSANGGSERGAQRRWDDKRRVLAKGATAGPQRRPQMVQFGR